MKLFTALVLALLAVNAQAQTEFNIASESNDLASQYKKELDHWMLAAYEGDRDAQFKVGVLFTNAQFSEPDFEQAVYWYKQAARQGHTLAQYNLGHQYLIGEGVSKNEGEAIRWWLEAAKQDHPLAQFNIGRAYYLGIALEQSEQEARKWFERAAANGEPKSAAILVDLGWDENLDELLAQSRQKASEQAAEAEAQRKRAARSNDFVSRVTPADQAESAPAQNQTSQAISAVSAIEPNNDRTVAQVEPNDSPKTQAPTIAAQQAEPDTADTLAQGSTESLDQAGESRFSRLITSSDSATVSQSDSTQDRAKNESSEEPSSSPSVQTSATAAVSESSFSAPARPSPNSTGSSQSPSTSVALYGNPSVRSVLISLAKDVNLLTVVKRDSEWTIVNHRDGFPVWVHEDFLQLRGKIGTITGDNVNARSVPIIAKETTLDRFRRNERVTVLGKRKDWYRVTSPARFQAWVKTRELDALLQGNAELAGLDASSLQAQQGLPVASSTAATSKPNERQSDTPSLQSPFPAQLKQESDRHVDWLFAQPPSNYTIQLASFDKPDGIASFVNGLSFKADADLHQLEAISYNRFWTYFVYGSFADKAAATQMKANLGQSQGLVRVIRKLQANRCLSWHIVDPGDSRLERFCANIEYK